MPAPPPRCPTCRLAYVSPPGGGPACRCAFSFAPVDRAVPAVRDDLQRRLWALAEVPRATSMETHTPASTRFFTPSPWPDSQPAADATQPRPATSGGDDPGWHVRAG